MTYTLAIWLTSKVTRSLTPSATTGDDEIAFRAAINVLHDAIDSMPSGLLLAPGAADLHEWAVQLLEALLLKVPAQSNSSGGEAILLPRHLPRHWRRMTRHDHRACTE